MLAQWLVLFLAVEARRPRLVLGWVDLQGRLCIVKQSPFVGVDLKLRPILAL
jgi:hypothetical protein